MLRKFCKWEILHPVADLWWQIPHRWNDSFWKIPVLIGIPFSLSCIPDSKAQDSGFRKEKFPHSEIRIPLHYLVSNRERLVRVGLLWDKQHEPHIVRKSTLKLATFSSLVFIGTILNEWRDTAKKYTDVRTMCPAGPTCTSLRNF